MCFLPSNSPKKGFFTPSLNKKGRFRCSVKGLIIPEHLGIPTWWLFYFLHHSWRLFSFLKRLSFAFCSGLRRPESCFKADRSNRSRFWKITRLWGLFREPAEKKKKNETNKCLCCWCHLSGFCIEEAPELDLFFIQLFGKNLENLRLIYNL